MNLYFHCNSRGVENMRLEPRREQHSEDNNSRLVTPNTVNVTSVVTKNGSAVTKNHECDQENDESPETEEEKKGLICRVEGRGNSIITPN